MLTFDEIELMDAREKRCKGCGFLLDIYKVKVCKIHQIPVVKVERCFWNTSKKGKK